MSTPSSISGGEGGLQHAPTPTAAATPAADDENTADIPKRPMRVKVLYTFDDQNKSNCLARLPNALNIPVVSLDETTQVGVIELKTCIQAIVSASPELVAKLGHDYTVYAYDFSEYETPLVGQGMLSWILASASNTPNAPADESQTMVTGRVCKNILGIFSNGVKETLEVKLKLVPVPTCMQKEYVENMERYHSLSQLMPEGFDYSAWSDFLKENPTLGQLAQPTPGYPAQPSPRSSFGGVEPFHQMLTRQGPSQDSPRNDSYDLSNMSFNPQTTRASSPAMSTISFHHYQHSQHSQQNSESRPASRASVRSDAAAPPQQFPFSDPYVMEQQEDGPPKKRARIMQAKRPKRTPLTAPNDSLRVTASTAASVRLHRPVLGHSAASADLVPRAPTPRPGDSFGSVGQRRPPAPSALRHASMDYGQPYMSPYDTNVFSDNAVDSADETEASPGGTPDIPSSPPVILQGTVSPAPSSPTLPTLPIPTDSGFVSDMPTGRDEDGMNFGDRMWDGSDLPLPLEERAGPRQNKSQRPWQHVNPGPVDRLPQSYVPRPKQHYRKHPVQPVTESIEQEAAASLPVNLDMLNDEFFDSALFQHEPMNQDSGACQNTVSQPGNGDFAASQNTATSSFPSGATVQQNLGEASQPGMQNGPSPELIISRINSNSESEGQITSRSATPNPPFQQSKPAKPRGLPRSNTWSGPAEPMSDAPMPTETNNQRSGSGAKRKKYIKERLEKAIAAGEMPQHCVNCGEIDTPAWRKAYTRVEIGKPDDIEVTTDATSTGIIAYEVIEPSEENGDEPKYRIFKNNLAPEEKSTPLYECLNLCNPCGLWLIKKASMRPQKQWDKTARMNKRKKSQAAGGRTKSMSHGGDLVSDAIMPDSEPIMPGDHDEGNRDGIMQPPPVRAASAQATTNRTDVDAEAVQAALRRAIQSSPAGLRGSKNSPIDIDPDLTPKPTRRLLFPSPRKDGEVKSLVTEQPETAPNEPQPQPEDNYCYPPVPDKPRCQRCKILKKGCDRERPCGRCDNAGVDYDGCIPCEPPRTNWFEQPVVRIAAIEEGGADKENRPPSPIQEEDNLAHLFEDPASAKTTPKKDQLFQDLLKTPTPGSRHRAPLTPKRGVDSAAGLLMTPSRVILTPRSNRGASIAPDTPFTRQLNALLSDCPMPSPTHPIDFSTFTAFNSPGRGGAQFSDFLHDDFLSSDMPVPSSPSRGGSMNLGFDLYEDPNTSTVGLWSGGNIFGSDTIMSDADNNNNGSKNSSGMSADDGPDASTLLKMNVGGITVDFAAMIEEVVTTANNNDDKEEKEVQIKSESPEAQSVGLAKTPEEPVVE